MTLQANSSSCPRKSMCSTMASTLSTMYPDKQTSRGPTITTVKTENIMSRVAQIEVIRMK